MGTGVTGFGSAVGTGGTTGCYEGIGGGFAYCSCCGPCCPSEGCGNAWSIIVLAFEQYSFLSTNSTSFLQYIWLLFLLWNCILLNPSINCLISFCDIVNTTAFFFIYLSLLPKSICLYYQNVHWETRLVNMQVVQTL